MKSTPISPELRSALKHLKLGYLVETLPDRIAMAEKQKMPFEDLLLSLLSDEVQRRQGSAASRRAERAGLNHDMLIERWDATAKVTFDRRVFQELCSLRFVDAHRNVVVLGPVG